MKQRSTEHRRPACNSTKIHMETQTMQTPLVFWGFFCFLSIAVSLADVLHHYASLCCHFASVCQSLCVCMCVCVCQFFCLCIQPTPSFPFYAFVVDDFISPCRCFVVHCQVIVLSHLYSHVACLHRYFVARCDRCVSLKSFCI